MRKKFLKWLISILLPHYHLQKNRPGRRKKVETVNMEEVQQIVEGMGKGNPLDDGKTTFVFKGKDYTHSTAKFPGRQED